MDSHQASCSLFFFLSHRNSCRSGPILSFRPGYYAFSTVSLYKFLMFRGITWSLAKVIWKAKVPVKIKCFVGLCLRNKLNTREELEKKVAIDTWEGVLSVHVVLNQ